jgi:hypothetical protein
MMFVTCIVDSSRGCAYAHRLAACARRLRSRLVLLLAEERVEADTGDLDDLETASGNISLRLTGSSESSDEHLIVLVDEVERTVARHEGGHLLTVLDELHTHGLTDSRVRLLRLNAAAGWVRTKCNAMQATRMQRRMESIRQQRRTNRSGGCR